METMNPIVRRWRQDATENPDQFWARAAQQFPWFCTWERVFEEDEGSVEEVRQAWEQMKAEVQSGLPVFA